MVSESMDRPLTFRERMQLHIHLMMCSFCTRFASQLQMLRLTASRYGMYQHTNDTPQEVLSEAAKERIRRALCE